MFLENKKLLVMVGLFGWAVMAFFTFFNILKFPPPSCYFLSYWPFCGSVGFYLEILKLAILTFIFVSISLLGYFSFKNLIEDQSRLVWVVVPLILVFVFFVLPFASNDLQFYFSLGKAVDGGINPYVEPWVVENNFFYPKSNSFIEGVMYGPLSIDFFLIFYKLSGGSLVSFILLWKLLMLAILVVCGFLIMKICNFSLDNKKTFYLFWFTQPLLLFEWVGNGHFDGIWLLFILLSFIFARSNLWGLVVISLVIGTWIKFIPVLFAPWFLLWWWQEVDRINWLKRLSSVSAGVLVSAVITVVGWWPYWQGFSVFKPIILQSKWAVHSLFATFYYSLEPVSVGLFDNRSHWFLTRFLHLVLFFVAIYFLWPLVKGVINVFLRKSKWDFKEFSIAIFLSLFTYLFVWQKSFWPWYSIWVVVIGIIPYLLTKNIYLGKILLWLSSVSLFFYVPWMMFGGNAGGVMFNWFGVLIFSVYPLLQLFLWRSKKYSLIW
jgi:hypothetical protein